MYYLFPFHLIKKDSKIVLYGAGNAGKNFAKQIEITNHCVIVGVIDKDYINKQVRNYPTYPIEWLIDNANEYDSVFITIVDDLVQNEVNALLTNMGVDKDKIVSFVSPCMDWDKPNRGFLNQKDEYESFKNIQGYIKEISPNLLLTSKRIDVMVRFLLFRDLMNNIENKRHLSLFSRFTMARTGGKESASYFSGKGKSSVQEFVEKGKELCNSIKENGFEASAFLPIGTNYMPYDGLHRLAAALAAGENLYVHKYDDRKALVCDMRWFKEQGFSLEDRIDIVRAFVEMYPGKCGMFVLYSPNMNLWDYIEGQISQKFTIVDSLDFHYENNYIAFENVLRQIYWDENQYSEWLTRKLDLLSLAPLRYRIVVVSDESKNQDFYEEIRSIKKRFRESLSFDVDGRVPIQIHSSDTESEFEHLSKIFLSSNQYNWEMKKINSYYRGWFLGTIGKLKVWCSDNNVSIDDVCIVGSAVMELFGLRQANNINFIIESHVSYSIDKFDSDLEVKNNYCLDADGKLFPDDIVISDSDYHFVFTDVKFCNLEFVYRYKKARNSEKDLLDLKRLDDWRNMITAMEDRQFLNHQVQIELYKRGLVK